MKRRMNGYLLAGLIVTGLMAALILVGLVWTPYDPDALLAGPKLEGPSLAHWLGTDSFGRDIFSRVLQGAGTTFLIALSTVAIGAVCGTAAGALTGYFGGVVDEVLMRLNDALTAFPSILLALVLISILGPGNKYNVVIALGIVSKRTRAFFIHKRRFSFKTSSTTLAPRVRQAAWMVQSIGPSLPGMGIVLAQRKRIRAKAAAPAVSSQPRRQRRSSQRNSRPARRGKTATSIQFHTI